MMAANGGDSAVAELQGLDGAYSFPEYVLQRIWQRGDFDRERCRTLDGKSVRVRFPGRWNRLGGPDFIGAKIEIGGERLEGDIELHLRAQDWKTHGHVDDPRYRSVILHVVLFPAADTSNVAFGGGRIPVVSIWPILHRSLEEYAEDEAIERLAGHPLSKARESWLALTVAEQRSVVRAYADERWRRKVASAAQRIQRRGWAEACHHTALEILGFRFNRAPMLGLAAQFPLECWPAVAVEDNLETLIASQEPHWHRQAIRPANQPRTRLRQYALWTKSVKDWPRALRDLGPSLRLTETQRTLATAEFRRDVRQGERWEKLSADVCAHAIPGTRFNTLACDGFLPLLAAVEPTLDSDLACFWFHAPVGDAPEFVAQILSASGTTQRREQPLCHGFVQGFLAWSWREEEARRLPAASP